jgi:hypothetical protein
MNFTLWTLVWTAGLVVGYVIGRFERFRVDDNRADSPSWGKSLSPVQDCADEPPGYPVNFDRLSDLPPRH